jgi:predicted Fe-Mo cluster-binding NifX family protein
MRIAISADDANGLESVVSPHFGRCPYFIVVDVADGKIASVKEEKNPSFPHHQPGEVPRFISTLGADVMIAGGMGRRAIMFFEQLGIEGVAGAYGTVQQVVDAYLSGRLRGAEPCAESKAHMQPGHDGAAGYEKDDVGRLREEAELLRRQLDEATRRVEEVERERTRERGEP